MNQLSLFFILAKLPNNLELLRRPQTNQNLHYSQHSCQLNGKTGWNTADETR